MKKAKGRNSGVKKANHAIAVALGMSAGGAWAQSAMTLYGLIDIGPTFYSSAATSTAQGSVVRLDSGISQASRWGFRGVEDLGSGRSAYFTLESGFTADDGALGQGGAIFGRQAYVGMKDASLGSLALGRQYDFMSYLGAFYAMGSQSAAGAFAWGLHADAANNQALNDHTYAGDRTNNSIKYESPQYGPLSFGAMYGLGEVPGNPSSGRTVSARISADFAKFSTSAAYTDVRNAAGDASIRIYGLGASYQEGNWHPFAMITQARNTATDARATTYELGVTYALTRALDFSTAYQYQQRNHGIGDAQAAIATFDYKFSKRTDVYLAGVYDRDRGFRAFPVFGGGIQSADGVQTAVRVGIRHKF